MIVIKKSAVVPYKPEQMYDLVNDIGRYPEFVPWCTAATFEKQSAHKVHADIAFAKGGIHHSFSTINTLHPHTRIEVRLLKGPFRHLEGYWRFEKAAGGGCRVNFDLEFKFINGFLDKMVGPLLEGISNVFLEAFCKRADELYGRSLDSR